MKHEELTKLMVDVCRKAHFLCDDTCDDGKSLTCPTDGFDELTQALDALDALPEQYGLNVCSTGAARIEFWLKENPHPDTARLDYLETMQGGIGFNVAIGKWGVEWEAPYGETCRDAIDKAAKQEGVTG